jgi:hypothetical protein
LLTAAGHDAGDATLGLFSGARFSRELAAEAARGGDKVLLIGLDVLYGLPA